MRLVLARPEALLLLLLGIPLVLLHLYRRRRVVVPFLPLLQEAVGPRRAGGGFQRLRERVGLLLRLTALSALALALAGPQPPTGGRPPPALVLVVDGDLTTAAREPDGRTRRDHLLEAARAWRAHARWRWVATVEARAVPLVVQPPGTEYAETALPPGPGVARGDLASALRLAGRLADREDDVRVVVLTARALPGAAGLPRAERFGVGETRANQGLVALDARADEGGGVVIRLAVRNEDEVPRRRSLKVAGGDAGETERAVDLAPGETLTLDLAAQPPEGGGWLHLRLEGRDAFARDDEAWIGLPDPVRPSVLVVRTGGARPYTRAALEALADQVDLDRSGSVRAEDLARAGPRDVYLVDGVELPEGALRPGAWLFLAPLRGTLPFTVSEVLEEPLVWRTRPDHPLLRDVDLDTAYVARGQGVSGEGLTPLAEAEGRAVLAEGRRDDLHFVVLGLDPEASDLPVRAAFPLLIRNALRRLAGGARTAFPPFLRPGEVLRPRTPLPGGPAVTVRYGDAERSGTLAPESEGMEIPAGAHGPVEVVTEGGFAAYTAFVDLSEGYRVGPEGTAAPLPAPAPPPSDLAARARRALVALAALLLLGDVLWFAVIRRRGKR